MVLNSNHQDTNASHRNDIFATETKIKTHERHVGSRTCCLTNCRGGCDTHGIVLATSFFFAGLQLAEPPYNKPLYMGSSSEIPFFPNLGGVSLCCQAPLFFTIVRHLETTDIRGRHRCEKEIIQMTCDT